MSTVPTTDTTDIRALAVAVRGGGTLTLEQRERLAALLINIDTAVKLAPGAPQRRPDYASAYGVLAGAWELVERAYAGLLGASATHGD